MQTRFGWLGESRKAKLIANVAECLRVWLREWCAQRGPHDLKVEECTAHDRWIPEGRGALLQSDQGCLFVALREDRMVALGTRLAGMVADEGRGLAEAVAAAALEDCLCCLAGIAGISGVVADWQGGGCPSSLDRPEWGGFWAKVSFDHIDFLLALDRSATTRLAPERRFESRPLQTRVQAMESATVELSAVMAFADVGMLDLTGLREGDVLVSERRLDEAIELRAPGGHMVARARIGHSAGRKAVIATAAEMRQEET